MLAEEISALAFPISIAVEIKAIKTSLLIIFFITPSIDEKKIMYDDNATADKPASFIEFTKLNFCPVIYPRISIFFFCEGKHLDVNKTENKSAERSNNPSLGLFNIPIPTALTTKAIEGLFTSPMILSRSSLVIILFSYNLTEYFTPDGKPHIKPHTSAPVAHFGIKKSFESVLSKGKSSPAAER